LFGAPGVGKGTIAVRLSVEMGMVHVSTGDILREELAKKTDVGEKVREFLDSGLLVPDDIVLDLLKKKMGRDRGRGFVFDGFPRTVDQAKELDGLAAECGQEISHVFNIVVPEDIVVKRLCSRRICPKCGAIYNTEFKPPKKDMVCDVCGSGLVHRSDDRDEVIRVRLHEYGKKTRAVLEYYEKRKLVSQLSGVDGEELFRRISPLVGK